MACHPRPFSMNTNKNKRIVAAAIFLFLLATFFPPWLYTIRGGRGIHITSPAGYSCIFLPPKQFYGAQIDTVRLGLEWLAILALAGTAWFLLRNDQPRRGEPRKPPDGTKDQPPPKKYEGTWGAMPLMVTIPSGKVTRSQSTGQPASSKPSAAPQKASQPVAERDTVVTAARKRIGKMLPSASALTVGAVFVGAVFFWGLRIPAAILIGFWILKATLKAWRDAQADATRLIDTVLKNSEVNLGYKPDAASLVFLATHPFLSAKIWRMLGGSGSHDDFQKLSFSRNEGFRTKCPCAGALMQYVLWRYNHPTDQFFGCVHPKEELERQKAGPPVEK
jgi:hypothetical protein